MRMLSFFFVAFFATTETNDYAFAHARCLESTPADGDVLASAPQSFVLTFSEPVSPIVMRLVEADGSGTDLAQIQAEDETVVITAPPIKPGTHALSWRVISADGHAVGGSIVFSVGEATATGIVVQTSTARHFSRRSSGARDFFFISVSSSGSEGGSSRRGSLADRSCRFSSGK